MKADTDNSFLINSITENLACQDIYILLGFDEMSVRSKGEEFFSCFIGYFRMFIREVPQLSPELSPETFF